MPTILVIEDDAALRAMVVHLLEEDGHTVIAAANGRSGLQRARDSAPDIVLVDLIMPDKDGLEIIVEIHGRDPEQRMIAMSGGGYFNRDTLLRMARQLGAWDVLPKPFSPEELKHSIDAALDRNATEATLHLA